MTQITRDLSRALFQLAGSLNRGSRMRLGGALVLMAAAAFLTAAPAVLIGRAVDEAVTAQAFATRSVLLPILILGAAILFLEAVQFGRKLLTESVAVRVQADTQLRFADVLLASRVEALHGRQVGEIMTLIDKGIIGMVRLLKLAFLDFGPAIAAAMVAVAFVVAVHPAVAAIMIAVLAANAVVTVWQIHSQRGIRVALLERQAAFNGQVGELLMNFDSVRASGVTELERAAFRDLSEAIRETELRHHKAMMRFDALKGITDGGGLVIVLISALALFASGKISGGDVVQITLLFQNAVVPLRMLHRVVDESHEAAVQMARASEISELPVDPGLSGTAGFPKADACSYAFRAERLSYGYPGFEPVLRNLSYSVPRSAFDVIFGETGTGKSTFLHILLGLNADYEGNAQVLGTEIKLADKDQLAHEICYVAQQPFIRSGTLRSNLLLGHDEDVSDSDLTTAAAKAGLELGVGAWRAGLDRKIAERGKGLSGGEKQRIALARLFLSDASLFILDEATSQLDEPMENFVLANLAAVSESKAVIMVAHRSSTRKWARRCYHFVGGRLAELPMGDAASDCAAA